MNIAFSPCPNDTFIFHAWAHGLIPGAPTLNVTYADIDQTNGWAADPQGTGRGLEILKISYAALPWALPAYRLLPCGGALGRGCGPLVLTAPDAVGEGSDGLSGKTVAVPSERSTAYMLFRLWAAEQVAGGIGKIAVLPFHEIMPAVRAGMVDAGLVIHEARFTYSTYGLAPLVDLGEWWETDTGLPIPLGAIVAHRSLDPQPIARWIRASVEYAWAHPQASHDYVMRHAQEMDPRVAQAHIDLYVNEFSADLGGEGFRAVAALLGRAKQEGLVPDFDLETLRA